MSKFIDLVTARPTGQYLPPRPALAGFVVEDERCRAIPHTNDVEMRVALVFERFMRVSGKECPQKAAHELERQFKNELKRLIYSDLEPLLHNLRCHVYATDNVDLHEALTALVDHVCDPVP